MKFLHLVPSRLQWKSWSIPSKLTFVGVVGSVISIIISLVTFGYQETWPKDADIQHLRSEGVELLLGADASANRARELLKKYKNVFMNASRSDPALERLDLIEEVMKARIVLDERAVNFKNTVDKLRENCSRESNENLKRSVESNDTFSWIYQGTLDLCNKVEAFEQHSIAIDQALRQSDEEIIELRQYLFSAATGTTVENGHSQKQEAP